MSNVLSDPVGIIFDKQSFSKMVFRNVFLMEERKWHNAISQCQCMSLCIQIHYTLRPIHILSILSDNPDLRLSINCLPQLASMKIISKECALCRKYVLNYNMHVLLSCFHVLPEREHFSRKSTRLVRCS